MKPFESVMGLLGWLADNGVRYPVGVITDWNPQGKRLRIVKPVKTNRRQRQWLHQRHDQLFFHTLEAA